MPQNFIDVKNEHPLRSGEQPLAVDSEETSKVRVDTCFRGQTTSNRMDIFRRRSRRTAVVRTVAPPPEISECVWLQPINVAE